LEKEGLIWGRISDLQAGSGKRGGTLVEAANACQRERVEEIQPVRVFFSYNRVKLNHEL
jgi:hypothetical protein